jgi:aspartate aminotransferase-like enzyme
VITVEAGVFGARWSKIAAAYGLNVVAIKAEYGDSVPPERLEDALREHGNAKAVFTQLSETSTGAMMDIKGYGEAVSKTDAALVVDGISGIGAMEMQTDEWAVDVAVTGSQKGLMMPPGLAFISVSEKAWRLAEKSKLPKFYFDLAKAKKALGESGTPWTPAITLVMQLKEALSLIRAETMEGMWRRHAWLADAARSGAAALGLKLFAKVPGNVLTSIAIPAGMDGVKFVRGLRDKYGVVFAGGQESLMGKIFRIGHLGYMDRFDMIIALAAVEMALADAGYPVRFGAGVAAAEEILTHDL